MNGKTAVKQMEATRQEIGGNGFYIYPFPAFLSANLSGEIAALLMPMVASVLPAAGGKEDFMDMDAAEAATYLADAFSGLSGDRVENLLRKLLLSGNIGVLTEGSPDARWLTEDLCNEVFCGNTQDMFILAFHVIKVNYAGFFANFGNLSGKAAGMLRKTGFPGTAPLT